MNKLCAKLKNAVMKIQFDTTCKSVISWRFLCSNWAFRRIFLHFFQTVFICVWLFYWKPNFVEKNCDISLITVNSIFFYINTNFDVSQQYIRLLRKLSANFTIKVTKIWFFSENIDRIYGQNGKKCIIVYGNCLFQHI